MRNKYYTSRDPIKNYFPLPNEVFALGLSPGALAVYSYLMYIEDRTTYQCHASYSPTWIDGKKHARNVYAHTREECEEKLKVLIAEMKAELAELKRQKTDKH